MPKVFSAATAQLMLAVSGFLHTVLSHATYWEVKRRTLTHHTLHCSYLSKGYLPKINLGCYYDAVGCSSECLSSSTILSLAAGMTGLVSLKELFVPWSIFNKKYSVNFINLLSILERALAAGLDNF